MRQRFVTILAVSAILLFSLYSNILDAFGKGQFFPAVTSKRYGYDLQQSREGVPVLVSKAFLNTNDVAQNAAVIVDIRKDDISVFLAWHDKVASPRALSETSFPWTPQTAGEYQIRAFVVSNMTNPEVLEDVSEVLLNVRSNEELALYSDRPTDIAFQSAEAVEQSDIDTQIVFGGNQHLGGGLNTGIGDIATSASGLYVIGTSEIPRTGGNPATDAISMLPFFVRSIDRGLTFEPMRYLVNNSPSLTYASSPLVHAVNDTLLYVSWLQQDYSSGAFKLLVGKSLDAGKTFADGAALDHAAVIPGGTDIAVSNEGRSLYIAHTEVYHDGAPGESSLKFTVSNDYATSFGQANVIAEHSGSDEIRCAHIALQEAADSSRTKVYVTWRENSEEMSMKLSLRASYDDGATFNPSVVIRETYTEDFDCPTIAINGDDIYLFWTETKLIYRPEDPSEGLVSDNDVFFAASRDSGRSFEPAVNLSEGIGAFTTEPAIIVSGGKIYAAWRDTPPEVTDDGAVNFYGNAEVIMTRSPDGGRTFEKPVNLSNNPTGSYAPRIAVHGDSVYVVWLESTFPSNEAEVSLRISGDGGKTFGSISENIVGSIAEPFSRPRILTSPDGANIYLLRSQIEPDEGTVDIYVRIGDVY